MSYCKLSDILNVVPERELINLTNDNPSSVSCVDEDRFEAVSKDADSLINGYLRARYTLPLKIVPNTVTQIATDICAYRLYLRRPQIIPEHITKNYDKALILLSDIQKGRYLIETPTEDENSDIQPTRSAYRVNKTRQDKIFNDRIMSMYGLPKKRKY